MDAAIDAGLALTTEDTTNALTNGRPAPSASSSSAARPAGAGAAMPTHSAEGGREEQEPSLLSPRRGAYVPLPPDFLRVPPSLVNGHLLREEQLATAAATSSGKMGRRHHHHRPRRRPLLPPLARGSDGGCEMAEFCRRPPTISAVAGGTSERASVPEPIDYLTGNWPVTAIAFGPPAAVAAYSKPSFAEDGSAGSRFDTDSGDEFDKQRRQARPPQKPRPLTTPPPPLVDAEAAAALPPGSRYRVAVDKGCLGLGLVVAELAVPAGGGSGGSDDFGFGGGDGGGGGANSYGHSSVRGSGERSSGGCGCFVVQSLPLLSDGGPGPAEEAGVRIGDALTGLEELDFLAGSCSFAFLNVFLSRV
ncbi:unnamed protein product [Phaeothamnion confervicola]